MNALSDNRRDRVRAVGIGSLLFAVAAFGLLLLVGGSSSFGTKRSAYTPAFLPVYEIEAQSGSHTASLLNLPLPNVGVIPNVPTPVDINGDLLPDVTVAVNLVNAEGLFNNPPQLGQVIAPNIEINRLFTAPILTPGGDPLKINIKFTVFDLSGQNPNIVVRFGYNTGPGGSIPPTYKALVGGFQNLFNPVQAVIDTTGGTLIGLDPHLPDLGLSPQSSAYEGPLSTFFSLDNGPQLHADADLRFKPMPDLVNVSYGNDSAGQHFTYSHTSTGDVDLAAKANLIAGAVKANVDARIDRLPRQAAVDMLSGNGVGGISYQSSVSNGRLPDLSATADVTGVANHPIHARFDAEGLPQTLKGEWKFPQGAPPSVKFEGSGQGIGAIEARIQNYTGNTTAFAPYVPKEQQFASIQAGPGGVFTDETLIQARIERIRGATIAGQPDGSLVGQVNVGDGERPLEVHGEIDLRPQGKPYISATAKISPLPDQINFSINPAGNDPIAQPTRIKYQPTEAIDVDTEALVGLPSTTGAVKCGDPGTACGSVAIRNVPAADFITNPAAPTGGVEARLVNTSSENRVEIDAIPRPGGAPMDVFGSATLGPIDVGGGPAADLTQEPVYASFQVEGLPKYWRMRSFKDPNQNLKRFDVRTCAVDYTTQLCAPGTEDQVAEMTFDVRNFKLEDRAATGVPAPPQSGPLFVTVSGRGENDPSRRVHFQVTGRMTGFKQMSYVGTGDITGVKTDIGGNQDFRAFVDVKNIDLNGAAAGGRINVDGDIRVQRLPAPLTFCFAQNGRTVGAAPLDPITAKCENSNPFGDGTVSKSPMTIAYDAGAPFDVIADVAIQGDFPFTQPTLPVSFGRFDRVAAHVGLTNIPGQFTGYIQTPGESGVARTDGNTSSATRILTDAPGAQNTKLELSASLTTPGVNCNDPNPNGGAVCASVVVDQLPPKASVLAETVTKPGAAASGAGDAVVEQRVQAHTCDWDFFGGTNACRASTETGIGVIKVAARAHAGSGAENPVYQSPAGHYLFAQATVNDLSNFEVEAGMQILQLKGLSFHQDPEGVKIDTNLGDGIQPLTIHGFADLRNTTNLVPNALRASVLAELVIAHLPQTLSISQTGPGKNQANPMVVSFDSSAATVVTAKAELRQREAAPNAACGDRGTVCANLTIDDLPSHLDATIVRTFTPIVGNERNSDTRIFVNQSRFANPAKKLDITAHAAIGLPADTPLIGEGPLVADLLLQGIPDHISANLQNHEVLRSNGPNLEIRTSALERFQLQTCKRDYDAETCIDGTGDDAIDLVQASVRTFDLRPTDFPTPPATHAPLYIGVTGRDKDVEGFVSIPKISEVQFLNRRGVTGAKARIGGTTPASPQDLAVRVDIKDLPVGNELTFGDQVIDAPTVTLKAGVDIKPFPGDVAFCMRQGGITPVPAASGIPFTQTCESTQPFGPTYGTPDITPLSVGFHSNVPFDVGVNVDVAVNGKKHLTNTPIDQQRLTGALSLNDLPADLVFHFLQPKVTHVATPSGIVDVPKGPFHALVDTPGAHSGLDLAFSAGYLVGPDAICKDPRPTVGATCISGFVDDLPTKVELFYNPDLDLSNPAVDLNDPNQTQNFFLHADGPAPTRIHDLEISTVQPQRESNGALTSPPKSKALVATATLDALPLPFDVRGTLDLPKKAGEEPTAIFEVQNDKKIPDLTVHVQNYTAPDPLAGTFVPVHDNPGNGLNTYQMSAIMRGDAFKLDAHIPGVQKVGLRAVRDTAHKPNGTKALAVGFGQDFNIRAYVDLQPDPSVRAIADLLVKDIPAEVDACIRGPREGAAIGSTVYPGQGTFCDDKTKIADNEGAIEVAQVPNTAGRKLDIDAFARVQFGGGSSLLAGRVRVHNIPQVIQVRTPGGAGSTDLEVKTFSRAFGTGPLLPDGVDKLQIEAATFDLATADTPYSQGGSGPLPYSARVNGAFPFPAKPQPADGRQFVHVAADIPLKQFHVRGQIGRDDGGASSQFEHLLYSSKPCPTPDNSPVDYPRSPVTADTKYTCVKVGFDALSGGVDPLSLYAEANLGSGYVARLRNAGLSDIPQWVQFQLAQDEIYTDPAHKRGWRRPCGPISGPNADPGGPCMAPLLRFDQPNNPYIFGVAELAKSTDFAALEATDPIRTAPNFDLNPSEGGWGNGFFDNSGIAAKVVDFDNHTITNTDDDRIAGKVSFRLPIPQAITVDQPQTYNDDRQQKIDGTPVDGSKASDFRFHLRISRQNGTTVDQLGELAAMFAMADSGLQALVTKPCTNAVTAATSDAQAPDCPEYAHGISLPGEVGLTMYSRDNVSPLPDEGGKAQIRSSSLFQVDGRVSTPISAGARLIAGGAEVAKGIRIGDVEAAVNDIPAETNGNNPHQPSFRLRAELIKDKEKPTPASTATDTDHKDTTSDSHAIFRFETTVNVKVNRIFAGFDFNPTDGNNPARRLDAVIYMKSTRIGADIKGYSSIDPNVTTPAEFSAAVTANIDPLDFNMRSIWDFADVARQAIRNFITDTLGAPGWLADVIDWLIGPVIQFVQDLMNALPVQVRLKSSLNLQFKLDNINHFKFRANLLHAYSEVEGPGKAEIGPINWYIDEFSGGLDLDIPPIDIPGWLDWLPGIPDEVDVPPILLVGYAYGAGFPIGSLGVPLLIDFRKCGSGFPGVLTTVVPYSGGVNGVSVQQANGPQNFAIWPGTDPRMSIDGILLRWLFGPAAVTVGDFLVDIIAGPIICGAFDVDANKYLINDSNPASYHPGNAATVQFEGHPVPGQPGQPASLPPEVATPTGALPAYPLPVSFPPAALNPPTPPVADAALYSGPTTTISAPVALCGVHEFNVLTVSAAVTVASAASAAVSTGTGADCPAGSEGTLELRANTMLINSTGSVTGDGVSQDVAHFDAGAPTETYPNYRATGSSGGTNAGVGFDGSAPRAGLRSYAPVGNDTNVYPGGPGSSVGVGGFTTPLVAGTIPTAGAGGGGGGAIVLKADTALQIDGTVTADGVGGAQNTTGACDDNPDDIAGPGFQTHTVDPDGPGGNPPYQVQNDQLDPPIPPGLPGSKYEHSGFIGAGGGAGGGIALQARGNITVAGGAQLHAKGGNGGGGLLGAGGGGGGGSVKVLAPIVNGVTQAALNTATQAGLNGEAFATLCPGVPTTANPTDHDGLNPPPVGTVPDGTVQATDGIGVLFQPPVAKLKPYGPFWWPGGAGEPTTAITGYFTGAGAPNTTTMVTCAVKLPTAPHLPSGYVATPDPAYLGAKMAPYLPYVTYDSATPPNAINHGSQPSLGVPCGTAAGVSPNIPGATIVEIGRSTFTGAVVNPATFAMDINSSGYYGLYTVAIRPQTNGNSCFDSTPGDATDCLIEKLNGIEWVIGVDADRPTTGIPAPTEGDLFTVNAVTLSLTSLDQADLSGFDYIECQINNDGGVWRRCHDGDTISLKGGDGANTITVRGFDKAGNVSTSTVRTVYLDQGQPTAAAHLSGGTLNAGWYRTPPSVIIDSTSAVVPRTSPYIYRFDNGFETDCPDDTTAPFTCTVPPATVGLLSTGAHTFNFTAVNAKGVRKDPMQSIALNLDGQAPTVQLATVPFAPNRNFGGNPWFDTQPYLVVAAIDQFGASGLASTEIKVGGGPFQTYDPVNPPKAPEGVTSVCIRATDVAGNVATPPCTTIRVDSAAPSLSVAPTGGVVGSNGWYTSAPSVTVNSYNDGAGVGPGASPLAYRVDNDLTTDCATTSCTIPSGRFGTGVHAIHGSAVDQFDNRSLEQPRPTPAEVLKVDLEAPVVVPQVTPPITDGNNSWYLTTPYLTLTAVDPGAGSGVEAVRYSLNGLGGPFVTYTGPVAVPPGGHTLCWNANDVAGNNTPTACQSLLVDLTNPTTTQTPSAVVGGTGWYTSPITVTVGTDADADSTVNPAFDADRSDLCNDLTPALNPKQPSGTCVAVDGGPYVPLTGALSLGEGIHTVRSFAVDVAGRRGPVLEKIYKIDRSAPYVAARLVAPAPALNGWYRNKPLVVLRANDGEDGSGVTSLVYSIDNPTPTTAYIGPFEVGEGTHTIYWKASDIVGSRSGSFVVKSDLTHPTAIATSPNPVIFIPLLGGKTKLQYTVGDAKGPGDAATAVLRVGVIIQDATGNIVRRIDAGDVTVTKGTNKNGFVTWDGRDNSLLNILPLGVYYYRVVVMDEAGNISHGGESKPISIRLL